MILPILDDRSLRCQFAAGDLEFWTKSEMRVSRTRLRFSIRRFIEPNLDGLPSRAFQGRISIMTFPTWVPFSRCA